MRKFIAVTIAFMMVAVMLSSSALADKGNEQKGGAGAGKGQNQSQAAAGNDDKGNSHGQSHTPDKPKADGAGIKTLDNDDEDASEIIGDTEENADDKDGKGEPNGHSKLNKENKPDEKPKDGPNHGNAYGRVRNTLEVLNDIGLLAGEETAAQLNTLMTAYRDAKDTETAKTALTALLDALTQACTVASVNGDGETADAQNQLMLENLTKMRDKVMANAGNDNGTLLALIHSYEDALRILNHLEPIADQDDETETGAETNPVAVP